MLPPAPYGRTGYAEGEDEANQGQDAPPAAHSMPTHSRHRAQRAVTAAREMPVFTKP